MRTLTNYTLGLRSDITSDLKPSVLGFTPFEGGYGMTDNLNMTVARAGDETPGDMSVGNNR